MSPTLRGNPQVMASLSGAHAAGLARVGIHIGEFRTRVDKQKQSRGRCFPRQGEAVCCRLQKRLTTISGKNAEAFVQLWRRSSRYSGAVSPCRPLTLEIQWRNRQDYAAR